MRTLVNGDQDVSTQTFALLLSGGAEVEIHRDDPVWGKDRGWLERIPLAPNLVTTVGMNFLAQWVSSYAVGTNSQMTHMAIGTATTAASINQTTLPGEVVRVAFSAVSVSANSWTVVTTFGGGSNGIANVTITEAAIFNHPSSAQGVMYNRILVSSQFTLANSDIAAIRIYSAIGSR